jgi:tetratricopeptide (TPR) repeat protein
VLQTGLLTVRGVAVLAALVLMLLAGQGATAVQTQGGATDLWARDALTRALASSNEIGDPFHLAQTLAEIAEADASAGDMDLARANLKLAATAAERIDGEPLKAWALHDIGVAYVRANDFAAAEATALQIHDVRLRDAVFAVVADERRSSGDVPGALTSARRIQDTARQGQTLRAIANFQAARHDFDGAMVTARSIVHSALNSLALGDVAAAIARDGGFDEARQLAGRIRDSQHRSRALALVGAVQAEAGDIKGALVTLDQVEDKLLRAEALGRLAAARTALAPAEARATFTQAIAMVTGARGSSNRKCETLVEIARAQVVAGEGPRAVETLQKVLVDLPNVRREADRLALLGQIAPLQVRAGDFAGAFATAMRAEDPSLRPLLVRDIAASQAERGDVAGAITALRALNDRAAAAAGFFGILRTQSMNHDTAGMRDTIASALQTVRFIGSPELRAGALSSLAAAHAMDGDLEAAHAVFTEAMGTAAALDPGQQQAVVYARIADALADRHRSFAD